MRRTLLLSAYYFPVKVLTWQAAMTMLSLGKVEVLVAYDEEIPTPSRTFKLPAVLRLIRQRGSGKRAVRYSKHNVFRRDKFTCQYCGEKKRVKELTRDHMFPSSRGGLTNWENTLAACRLCNMKKRDKTCDEAGMFPLNIPRRPTSLDVTTPLIDKDSAPEEWSDYLGSVPA